MIIIIKVLLHIQNKMEIFDLLKNKKDIIAALLKAIDSNEKMANGLRKIKVADESQCSENFKVEKLLEVVANQSIQIMQLSLLNLIYAQSTSFDADVAKLMVKMGRGEEALKQMFKNKLDGK